MTKRKIDSILLKKATGYYVEEKVEEFDQNNEVTKRKVSQKYIPPDTAAIKAVLDREQPYTDIRNMSDDQLEELKQKLLTQLSEKSQKGGKK